MKSTTFKTRQDMIDYFEIQKDPDEVDVITDHLPEPKCGMDMLVESLREEKCCTICESAKVRGELGCQEGDYWEMKAEIHYGI